MKTCWRNVWWCLFLLTLQSPTLQVTSLYHCHANLTHLLETTNTEIQFKEKLILEKTAPSQPIPLEYSSIARRVIFPAEHTLLTTKLKVGDFELKLTLLIISLLKTSNIITAHKSKMVWNKKYNLRTRLVQFTDQKKV